jgi:L-ascorbate metabolism protein UlaG (beta-lactamase superfamily)
VSGIDAPDGVLVSHAHLDHLDLPSLRRLERSIPIFVPRGLAGTVRRAGLRHIIEVNAGDRVTVGEIDVLVTPAEHDGRRLPVSRAYEAVGYIIEGPHRVYFAGDTDLFEEMADLGGDLAVALLPVWGWGTKVGQGHLDPERAARAAALLRPRFAVPIHWGTLAAPRAPLSASAWPAHEFARLTTLSAPEVDVRVLGHGETLVLEDTAPTA